jgi:hypothetical protein
MATLQSIQDSIAYPANVTLTEGTLQIELTTADKELASTGSLGNMIGSLRFSELSRLAIDLGSKAIRVLIADEVLNCDPVAYLQHFGTYQRIVAEMN